MSYQSKGFQFSLLVHAVIFLLIAGISGRISESRPDAPVALDFSIVKELQQDKSDEAAAPLLPFLSEYSMNIQPLDPIALPPAKAKPLQMKPKKASVLPKLENKPKTNDLEEKKASPPQKNDAVSEPSEVSSSDDDPKPSHDMIALTGSSFSEDSPAAAPLPAHFAGGASDSGDGTGDAPGKDVHYGSSGSTEASSDILTFGSAAGPRFRHQEMPVYPYKARRMGKEGSVLLRLTIDETGRLENVEVLEDSGYGFADAAVNAVRKSSFVPPTINGRQIRARALLPVKFTLR